MNMLILDQSISNDLIAERQKLGIDRNDEVWDGVYVMPPAPNNMHHDIVADLAGAIREVVRIPGLGRVQCGANVSDRDEAWEHNYRCPDIVVALNNCSAIDRETHWQGGPDFLVEIRSPGDDSFEKLPFYFSLGVREVLVVERDRRESLLYRRGRTKFSIAKPTVFDGVPLLVSRVLPLAFRKVVMKPNGSKLEVRRTDGPEKTWLI